MTDNPLQDIRDVLVFFLFLVMVAILGWAVRDNVQAFSSLRPQPAALPGVAVRAERLAIEKANGIKIRESIEEHRRTTEEFDRKMAASDRQAERDRKLAEARASAEAAESDLEWNTYLDGIQAQATSNTLYHMDAVLKLSKRFENAEAAASKKADAELAKIQSMPEGAPKESRFAKHYSDMEKASRARQIQFDRAMKALSDEYARDNAKIDAAIEQAKNQARMR